MSGTWAYHFRLPKPKDNHLAEWDGIREEDNEEEQKENEEDELGDEQEEVEDAADEGEMLVLRRLLSNQRGVNDEQWENIFRSHCTVEGKVCR